MMNSDAQFGMLCNVHIRKINRDTGKEELYEFKNRATKIALLGIAKLIYGTYYNNPSESVFYIPKYVGLGYGEASVTVDDNRLDEEFTIGTKDPEDPSSYNYSRIEIASREIQNSIKTDFVTVAFSSYVPADQLQNKIINEAGLFSGENDNSCFARIAELGIHKGVNDVLDISWTVTIVSITND